MTDLEFKLACLHRSATTLPAVAGDYVELRHTLSEIVELAKEGCRLCQEKILEQRHADRPISRWSDPDGDIPRQRARRQRR